MKNIKLRIAISFALIFFACSAAPKIDKPAIQNPAIIEKNKETAILNEVGAALRDAQSLEKLGRDMNSYRLAPDAESRRTCNALTEDRRRETADLEIRMKNLPGNYTERLTAILPDLNECVSCSKKATDGCVKARAAINKTIKEIYP